MEGDIPWSEFHVNAIEERESKLALKRVRWSQDQQISKRYGTDVREREKGDREREGQKEQEEGRKGGKEKRSRSSYWGERQIEREGGRENSVADPAPAVQCIDCRNTVPDLQSIWAPAQSWWWGHSYMKGAIEKTKEWVYSLWSNNDMIYGIELAGITRTVPSRSRRLLSTKSPVYLKLKL